MNESDEDRWFRIESLFQDALQREPDGRDAYLREACGGDSDLHREITSLLAHHHDVSSGKPWAAAAAHLIVQPPLEPGHQVGPYQIVSFMAAGGMGAVYRARDPRMGREVAIKISSDTFGDRFSVEIRAAAALNHPNICHIYDVGPNYLVMELVEGPTLKDRLRQGAISLPEVLHIARQIVNAMTAAHDKGIVHCDLKPANIKIKLDGLVKVLDFGLAEWIGIENSSTPKASLDPGQNGAIAGTAAYMSPEQAVGKRVDARSDIFSFGVLLYEMLVGAIHEESREGARATIMAAKPVSLVAPPDLSAIVNRCLCKEPEDRYHTAGELKAALHRMSAGMIDRASIAVLPFENVSAEPEDEYFSDGLSEEIINALARISDLKVTARTSSFAFRKTPQDIRSIADALGVSAVLEGTVIRSGNRVRVTAKLINSIDGNHLWSDNFDRELIDALAVQDEIAAAIAGVLQLQLAGKPALQRHRPLFQAHEAFLKGRHYLFKTTPEAMIRSKAFFEESIALDPEYPDPHDQLGTHYLMLWFAGLQPGSEVVSLVRMQAEKALSLHPTASRSRGLLAFVAAAFDYDWSEAQRQFQLALAAPDVPADVRFWHAFAYLPFFGRFAEAIRVMESLLEEDPLNVFWLVNHAGILFRAQMYDRSLQYVKKTLDLDQNIWMPHFGLGILNLHAGALRDSIDSFEKAYALAPWNVQILGHFAGALARFGDRNRAEALAKQIQNSPAHMVPVGMMLYHSICSEFDIGAEWFEKAIEFRDPLALIYWNNPTTQNLKESRHWPRLAEMLGKP